MKTIAFFNIKSGVGKTSLIYNLAHMFADLGVPTLAVDLDPQANLTSMFLEESQLEDMRADTTVNTIYRGIQPLIEGESDIAAVRPQPIRQDLALVSGDLALASAEEELNSQWPACLDRKARAFRVTSALWRVTEQTASENGAKVVLLDVGPNLTAINRSALIAAQHVVVPLAPDMYSLQALNHLGPTLTRWRCEWRERFDRNPRLELLLPTGDMQPIGYVVMQHGLGAYRPVNAYKRWMDHIPETYRNSILKQPGTAPRDVMDDSHCLALLKHYRSLMPLAMEAHKPMFHLRPADGAIGAYVAAVQTCRDDFKRLAGLIAQNINHTIT